MLLMSQSPSFKLTMGTDKSIIEIYAYRMLIKSFLDNEKPHILMLQYIV